MLHRRLERVDQDRLARRAAMGEELPARLPPAYLHPGDELQRRTHWLFPVLAPDPAALVTELRDAGIDVSTGTSNLVAVPADDGSVPDCAGRLMSSIVYLPSYPELGAEGRAPAAGRAAGGVPALTWPDPCPSGGRSGSAPSPSAISTWSPSCPPIPTCR